MNRFNQASHPIGPLELGNMLDQQIPDPQLEDCAPLATRFAEWEKGVFDYA